MKGEEIILNSHQKDALCELCNIGMGHATTSLAQLVGRTIFFEVPRIWQLKVSEVPGLIGEGKEPVVGIYLRYKGPITGNILLIFPKKSALLIREIITGEVRCELIFDEYQISLLKEFGNILVGSYLSVMENLLGMCLVQSVPWFAFDLASAIVDQILIQLGEYSEPAIVIEAEFYVRESPELRGNFYLIPDPGSLSLMLKAMGIRD